ncbi:hypothetical protein [Modestobacter roseus]|uniref:Uncharacterized protein n=1 Tax=Modestobacter roseus TaxID=1181884 RepID=A0A562IWW0_9ACTN|nr:hypothetical protein [Modestobacter roseus]MQA36090.1 hypothetical protein [Modestobacter roseus]TWH75054.1 hypothetical protein JD78_03605 [Modestobacter roseus]
MARKQQPRRSAPPSPGVGHGEFVMYPGTRAEVYDLLERLSAAAGDSPDAGTPGLSLDRTRLVVRWFGEVPAAVQRVVDSAGEGLTVTVVPTEFRPGDLRAEAARIAAEHAPVVQAAIARPEADGVEVLVAPDAGDPAAVVAAAGVTSAFPLFAEVGEAG